MFITIQAQPRRRFKLDQEFTACVKEIFNQRLNTQQQKFTTQNYYWDEQEFKKEAAEKG